MEVYEYFQPFKVLSRVFRFNKYIERASHKHAPSRALRGLLLYYRTYLPIYYLCLTYFLRTLGTCHLAIVLKVSNLHRCVMYLVYAHYPRVHLTAEPVIRIKARVID